MKKRKKQINPSILDTLVEKNVCLLRLGFRSEHVANTIMKYISHHNVPTLCAFHAAVITIEPATAG